MTIQEYNDVYKNTVIKKMSITTSSGLTIKNSNIAQENITLEESLCSESNLRFGACNASCFKIRLLEMNHNFLGEWLDVSQIIYTDLDGYLLMEDGKYLLTEDGYRIQLETADAFSKYGRFKVYSDKPTNDRMWRDLTCYDVMYDILNADMLSWYKTLTFPITIKDLRDSFFAELGITQKTTTLVNDSFSVKGGFVVDGQLSGKMVIEAICELNGVFGHISHDGKFEYISLPSADTIALDWYYDGTGAYEGYVVEKITGVRAIGSDNDAGTTVGTSDNVYTVQNNPLIYGTEGTASLETALTNLLNNIKDITYRPFNVTTYGNPMLPLGTNLTIVTRDQTINSFVMSRQLKGIQALKDTYKAVGTETQTENVNGLYSQIKRTNGKVHDVVVDVDQLKSTIYDEDTGVLSVLEQTVNEIVMKVDTNGNIVEVKLGVDPDDQSATQFKVTADNIDFIANDKIQLTSKQLGIDSTYFKVDTDGKITSTGGTIGGFTIGTTSILNGMTSLSDTSHDGVYIGTDGIALGKGKFKVTNAGAVNASNLTITGGSITLGTTFSVTSAGVITASSGTIGGFTIDSSSIRSGALNSTSAGAIGLSTADFTRSINSVSRSGLRFAIGSKFGIANDGSIYCSNATITGSIHATSFTFDDTINMRSYNNLSSQYVTKALIQSQWYQSYLGWKINGYDSSVYMQCAPNMPAAFFFSGDMSVTSTVRATDFINTSSRLVKKNINAISDEKAKKLLDLNVVDFDYIKGKKDQTGLIAEDVIKVFPNVVNVPEGYNEEETKAKIENGEEPTSVLGIDYTKLVPYLIKMVQIQQKELEELKNGKAINN